MFVDLLRKRRSIRQFEEKPVPGEQVDLIVEAMLRSPSSRDLCPWEFVVVENPETIKRLAEAKPHGAGFLKNAPLAVAVCARESKSDVWVEDCAIAALNIHLAAADLGLGSCWIQIRKREHDGQLSAEQFVKSQLSLDDDMRVLAIVAIGYPKEEKPGRDYSTLLFDHVSYEKYGNKKD
ncbi:nitroreductase family protein [Desulforhopalus singaporensis]|uniref:Nitroreductase n=1 Tax=Desulforhopalus singaporensis TaxID=91360 RepID=A0A1H0LXZ7_9BACT|nr:nitroreductase family protein [Desulforhopalus singaporensis]SDO72921.1 Nitroreductase [Desulforhopalus singaporensis]